MQKPKKNADQSSENGKKIYVILDNSEYNDIREIVRQLLMNNHIIIVGKGFASLTLVKNIPNITIFKLQSKRKQIIIATAADRDAIDSIRIDMNATPTEWDDVYALHSRFMHLPKGGYTEVYEWIQRERIDDTAIELILAWMTAENIDAHTSKKK